MEKETKNLEPDPRTVNGTTIGGDTFLSITIGNGQLGASIVSIGNNVIAKGDLSTPHLVSSGGGELLKVQTNVLDVNPMTNKCVITTRFTNSLGQDLFFQADSGDAPKDGVLCFVGNYQLL